VGQEAFHLGAEGRVAGARLFEEGRPLGGGPLLGLVE
jgi:hypothetical protein